MAHILLLIIVMVKAIAAQIIPPEVATHPANTSTDAIGVPPQCSSILDKGYVNNTYDITSVARIYTGICPVINEYTDCLEQHRADFTTPQFKLMAAYFNKNEVRQRMQATCNLIASNANELECLKAADSQIWSCLSEYASNTTNSNLDLASLCSAAATNEACVKRANNGLCTPGALNAYLSTLRVFLPKQCDSISSTDPTIVIGTDTSVNIGLNSSVIARCGYEAFKDVIDSLPKTSSLGPDTLFTHASQMVVGSLRHLCRNATTFSTCVNDNLKQPYEGYDAVIARFIKPEQIGPTISRICNVPVTESEGKCLQESSFSTLICGIATFIAFQQYGTSQQSFTGTTSSSYDPNLFCSGLRSADTCVRIQLQRCSPALAEAFKTSESELLQTDCYNSRSSVVNSSPLLSNTAYCSVGMYATGLQTAFNNPRTDNTYSLVLNFTCKEVRGDFYSNCLAQEVVPSENKLDKAVNKILDLNNAARLQYIFRRLCDRQKEIIDTSSCLLKSTDGFKTCAAKREYEILGNKYVNYFTKNFTHTNVDSVTELCGPIKEFFLCNTRAMSNCSQSLSKLGEDVINELLQLDCGGSRPLTANIFSGSSNVMYTVKLTLFWCIFLIFNVFV